MEAYRAALAAGDRSAIEALVDEKFLITYPTGATADKQHYLADLARSPATVLSIDQQEVNTIVHDGVAVVSFAMATRIDFRGKEHTMRTRCTQVWKQTGAQWTCIAVHHCEFNA